jgi:NADH-quinone oxidoreductase subunit G
MPDWPALDDVLTAMATALPHLAPARDAAPDAAFRTPLGAVARAGWRHAGRTAHDQAGGIVQDAPRPDADSALAFSMEGGQGADAPPALRAGYGVPGLHSASAAPYLTDADRGALQDGDPGVSVLDGVTGPDTAPRVEITGEGLIPLPLHDPFAGDEVGRRAEYLAQRIPAAMVMLHPDDAKRLTLAEGAALSLDGTPIDACLTISAAMPEGHVGLPVARVAPRNLGRRVRIGGQT